MVLAGSGSRLVSANRLQCGNRILLSRIDNLDGSRQGRTRTNTEIVGTEENHDPFGQINKCLMQET